MVLFLLGRLSVPLSVVRAVSCQAAGCLFRDDAGTLAETAEMVRIRRCEFY